MYADHADEIFRFIYMHVRDEELAEDLTADTFTKAWKNIDSFDFKYPKAWLYAIARNLITDHWRKAKSLPLDEDFEIADDRESAADGVDRELTRKRLLGAVATLIEPAKSVVMLRFIEGLSVRETADRLGLTEANVRTTQFRALKKLKDVLS